LRETRTLQSIKAYENSNGDVLDTAHFQKALDIFGQLDYNNY
jgi:kynureninase